MTTMIYHIKDFTQSLRASQIKSITVRDLIEKYHHVATVDTSNLETAYTLTNSIDRWWGENDGLKFHGSHEHGMAGCRSTSVGDIAVVGTEQADGSTKYETFLVAMCGFTKIQEV